MKRKHTKKPPGTLFKVGPKLLPRKTKRCVLCGEKFQVVVRKPVSAAQRRWKDLQGFKPQRPEQKYCSWFCRVNKWMAVTSLLCFLALLGCGGSADIGEKPGLAGD